MKLDAKTISNGILRAIAILVGIAIFLFFLFKIETVIIYLIIAGVLSLIAKPIIAFLSTKLKFPNTLAVVSTIFIFSGFIMGLVSMFIPLITQQGKNLSLLNINELKADYKQVVSQINNHFLNSNIDIEQHLKSLDLMSNFKEIPTLLNSIVGAVGSLGIGLFSVLFISFFLMKDGDIIHKAILIIVPKKSEKRVDKSLDTIKNLLSRYFVGLVLQLSVLFILYSINLTIFSIENGIVIAFLCALLNVIPYIGPLIGGILMIFLTMSSNIGLDFKTVILPTTMYVMTGYIIAQLVDNFLSQPIIFSKSVKSQPLEIFLVIIIGGLLFGVVGMVVAVPSYTAIKVILKEFLSDNRIVQSLTKSL